MTRRMSALGILLVALGSIPSGAVAQEARYYQEGRYTVREIAGQIDSDAKRVRVETDLGTVRVRHGAAGTIGYRVRLKAAGADVAEVRRRLDRMVISASRTGDLLLFGGSLPGRPIGSGGLNVEFEIELPVATPALEVVTGAGDIEAEGGSGRTSLVTQGGMITARDVTGPLQAETRGGGIVVGDVRSTARLVSAGGDVSVDAAEGELVVQTSGGDVRIGRAGAAVRVETGGGNVRIERAAKDVRVATSGGNIDVGEAGGEVSAATAGGAIRVGSAIGGVRCETAAGPIVLDGVGGPIRALTSAGSIHALLHGAGLPGDSDLQAQAGDITVSLPEGHPITIRALVDNPVGRSIESEFPLTILRDLEDSGQPLEIGEGQIGVGGPVLKIRALHGRIVILKVKDDGSAKR